MKVVPIDIVFLCSQVPQAHAHGVQLTTNVLLLFLVDIFVYVNHVVKRNDSVHNAKNL